MEHGRDSKTNPANSEADTCPVWHRGEHSVVLYNETRIVRGFVNLFLHVNVGSSGHRLVGALVFPWSNKWRTTALYNSAGRSMNLDFFKVSENSKSDITHYVFLQQTLDTVACHTGPMKSQVTYQRYI